MRKSILALVVFTIILSYSVSQSKLFMEEETDYEELAAAKSSSKTSSKTSTKKSGGKTTKTTNTKSKGKSGGNKTKTESTKTETKDTKKKTNWMLWIVILVVVVLLLFVACKFGMGGKKEDAHDNTNNLSEPMNHGPG